MTWWRERLQADNGEIIRRILRSASMTVDFDPQARKQRHDGLESVKKTLQVA